MSNSVLLARQPIFDGKCDLYAHELLYRSDVPSSCSGVSKPSTRELLVNACTTLLSSNMNLGLPMFVNVDEEFLLADDFFPIAPQNVTFEILEDVEPTDQVLTRVRDFKRQGFKFALDDYILEPSKEAYFTYLSVIKIDVLNVDFKSLNKALPGLKQTGCLLLAEKVEDQAMFAKCIELGFDLFQGYFLERPSNVKGKKIGANQYAVLHLLSELSRDDIEVEEVAELISRDVGLVLKILGLINCPLYQLVREVTSVKDAVIILGLATVKQWAIILSLVSVSAAPAELFRSILIRAKTLSLYSKGRPFEPSSCFLLGLLSGIEAIFEIEMELILEHLRLDESIKIALLYKTNDLGELLNFSIGMERLDNEILQSFDKNEVSALNQCYQEALQWADEVMNYLD
ncbi:EAL and HDOD domain-containing protein [Paraglaciecola marina]|uniref:EAL and HDOD domain-containing protein n=1 Tax=Paraglaciecola marina TaxID=2500157 RepID=UPI00105E29B1|nr:HDOD domain-containing protein [Paraglaciecola marina]